MVVLIEKKRGARSLINSRALVLLHHARIGYIKKTGFFGCSLYHCTQETDAVWPKECQKKEGSPRSRCRTLQIKYVSRYCAALESGAKEIGTNLNLVHGPNPKKIPKSFDLLF